MKLRVFLLIGLCVVAGQARAGLFSDDEARQQIQQTGARVTALEEAGKQQTETNQQQTHTLLDLQSQIDALNAELRTLRGQNEEQVHGLQDAEKRQKDFYIDLDTRLRHFESAEAAVPPVLAPASAPQSTQTAETAAEPVDDIVVENRAYEAAHGLYKAGKHQEAVAALGEFMKRFPTSVYAPNASYELGSAYLALKDYQNALTRYQLLADKYAFSPKAPDALLGMATCQQELKAVATAKKTLKQLVAKYPGSAAADEAKKRLATLK